MNRKVLNRHQVTEIPVSRSSRIVKCPVDCGSCWRFLILSLSFRSFLLPDPLIASISPWSIQFCPYSSYIGSSRKPSKCKIVLYADDQNTWTRPSARTIIFWSKAVSAPILSVLSADLQPRILAPILCISHPTIIYCHRSADWPAGWKWPCFIAYGNSQAKECYSSFLHTISLQNGKSPLGRIAGLTLSSHSPIG